MLYVIYYIYFILYVLYYILYIIYCILNIIIIIIITQIFYVHRMSLLDEIKIIKPYNESEANILYLYMIKYNI